MGERIEDGDFVNTLPGETIPFHTEAADFPLRSKPEWWEMRKEDALTRAFQVPIKSV